MLFAFRHFLTGKCLCNKGRNVTLSLLVTYFETTSPEISRSAAGLEHCQYVGSSGDLEHGLSVGGSVSRYYIR